MKDTTPYLHIYAQSEWHGEAIIVGNRIALEALRDAIDNALATGYGAATAFVGDGEGFHALVVKQEVGFDKLAVPYTNEIASEKNLDALFPEIKEAYGEAINDIQSRKNI